MSNKEILILVVAFVGGALVGYSVEPTVNTVVVLAGIGLGVYFLLPILSVA